MEPDWIDLDIKRQRLNFCSRCMLVHGRGGAHREGNVCVEEIIKTKARFLNIPVRTYRKAKRTVKADRQIHGFGRLEKRSILP